MLPLSSLMLLVLVLLANTITCTIYTVTPDDHYTTCHHCHNLQHYLLNVTKYFTSNSQLLFLPGLHHLHTDLIIQNVHNISLIGSTTNGTTLDIVIIQCNSSVGITMSNITNLTMKNIQISNCRTTINMFTKFDHGILLKDCNNVKLNRVILIGDTVHHLLSVNTLGNSSFVNLTCNRIVLLYDEVNTSNKYHKLLIENYNMVPENFMNVNSTFDRVITVHMFQYSYSLELEVLNTKFLFFLESNYHLLDLKVMPNKFGNLISFNHCTFEKCQCGRYSEVDDVFHIESQEMRNISPLYKERHQVKFINCQFLQKSILQWCVLMMININDSSINVIIKDCIFIDIISQVIHMNNNFQQTGYFKSVHHKQLELSTVLISNTTFRNITFISDEKFISLRGTVLQLEGPVVFKHLDYRYYKHSVTRRFYRAGIIYLADFHSMVICHDHIDFSDTTVTAFKFSTDYGDVNTNKFVVIKENSFINMTNNRSPFEILGLTIGVKNKYNILDNLPCYFQYISQKGNLDNEIKSGKHLSYSIEIDQDMPLYYLLNHCRWLPNSAFFATRPVDVNKNIIRNFHLPSKALCVCQNDNKQNCYIDTLASVYPGQSITVLLSVNDTTLRDTRLQGHVYFTKNNIDSKNGITVTVEVNEVSPTACKLAVPTEISQTVYNHCTIVNYTIVHSALSYLKWCELFVRIQPNHLEGFYINILSCPPGFVQSKVICTCDPILKVLSITTCDINHQTVLRPAGIWISAVTINDSHRYRVSPHCPFHYCLPQSSQLSFFAPDSQCQFNRSGLLCGHCQQGLSTVFGYSHCQHCSNVYLLIVIPMAVAGLVLVLLLFIINLTVTDGDINGFILYVNIISINSHIFLPRYSNFINVFISLANLDLGIPTCFYNGMDDYAKMWLQLAFPAYLTLIATLLIIASRHSTKVQRITARRALPVLATLFLLSYTKTLHTVSSVLFHYSTITHLPSGHTTLVWAVDANVPLFGLKYTTLFIVCLILFIILLPFNAILCFTKTAMRLRLVNHFKPLIDAYQGPYKYKYYYWTGLQLVIRAVFFGLSALDRNTNLTIGITLLTAISIFQAKISPFKSEYKNVNDLCFLYSLLVIYIFSYGYYNNVIKIIIIMASLQFLFIIIYHIISSIHGGVIIYKLKDTANKIMQWITKLQVQNRPQQIELNNIPPDVAMDYAEYQEPLVGYD